MARKKVKETYLKDWEAVNFTLKEIAEHEQTLQRLEADMNARIDEIKLAESFEADPHIKSIKILEKRVKEFVLEHKEDLGNKKTRELTFGNTGFRKSTKLVIKDTAGTILKLIANKMNDCVNVKKTINKENLRKYSDERIAAAGAEIKVEDVFWYETKQEKLSENE